MSFCLNNMDPCEGTWSDGRFLTSVVHQDRETWNRKKTKTKSNPPGRSRAEPWKGGQPGPRVPADLLLCSRNTRASKLQSISSQFWPFPLFLPVNPWEQTSTLSSTHPQLRYDTLQCWRRSISPETRLVFFYLLSVFPVQLVVWVISCLHVDLWPLSRVGKGTKFLPSWYWILHTPIPLFIAVQRWKQTLVTESFELLYSSNLNFVKEDFLFIFMFHFIFACLSVLVS